MKVSITDEAIALPSDLGFHRLIGRNTGSNTIYFGFSADVIGDDGANQGIPVKADEVITIDLLDKFSLNPHFVCATGETSTLNYDFH